MQPFYKMTQGAFAGVHFYMRKKYGTLFPSLIIAFVWHLAAFFRHPAVACRRVYCVLFWILFSQNNAPQCRAIKEKHKAAGMVCMPADFVISRLYRCLFAAAASLRGLCDRFTHLGFYPNHSALSFFDGNGKVYAGTLCLVYQRLHML